MSDSDNTQDSAAMPPASDGSVGEPAAWGVLRVGGRFGYASVDREEAVEMQARVERMENWKYEVVPLYALFPSAVRLPKPLDKMHGETDYGKGYNTALRTCREIITDSGVHVSES